MERVSVPGLPMEHNGKAMPAPGASAVVRPRWLPGALLLGSGAILTLFGMRLFAPDGGRTLLATDQSKSAEGAALSRDVQAALDVVALGRLMPRGDLIYLAPPYGSNDARVARVLVREGQRVDAGEVLAELDNLPTLQANVATAQANHAAQQANLEQARANAHSAQLEAAAELARARDAAELAQAQARRQQALHQRKLIARAALEEAESNAVRAAREQDRATAHWQRQRGDDQQPDVALAITLLEVARQNLAQAHTQLANGFVRAPFAGTLITLHARTGEKAGERGIASFGDLDAMQAELEVYQTDIARVQIGQAVSLSSTALERALRGTVEQIGLEVQRQALRAADPAANTDARVVRVLVAIQAENTSRAAALSGLDVTARIHARP